MRRSNRVVLPRRIDLLSQVERYNWEVGTAGRRAQVDLIQPMDRRKLASVGFHPELEGEIESFGLAFRMQAEVPDVLDLRSEPQEILEMYGVGKLDPFAKQGLLARKLAASGGAIHRGDGPGQLGSPPGLEVIVGKDVRSDGSTNHGAPGRSEEPRVAQGYTGGLGG